MNPILQAYMAGIQQRTAREQNSQEHVDKQEQLKIERDRLKQQTDHDSAMLKHQQNIEASQLAIQQLGLSHDLSTAYGQTGEIPEGYQETSNTMNEFAPGVQGTKHSFRNEQSGHSFEGYDPQSLISLQKYKGEQLNEDKQQHELDKIKEQNTNKLAFEEINNQHKVDTAAQKAKTTTELMRESLRLKNGYTLEQQANRANLALDNPKPTKISPSDGKTVDFLKDIYSNAVAVKSQLDSIGWNFFQGNDLAGVMSGMGNDTATSLKGGETDSNWAGISTKLGTILQKIAKDASGTTLSASERQLLDTHVPEPKHRQSTESAKAKLNGLIEEIPFMLQNIQDRYTQGTKSIKVTPTANDLFPVKK